ncbi:nuclear envelope phosphatase-regulatory subunit 1 [Hyalella azteca]|uniref:Transmembrane protein 188 n=1 Tax=Hyalella azteca TaxID=294128 RepID=A0A8B7PCI4_HYAAZ|nr:nuclear envelope phosphatase-regulatory subunit 1 [Hyalella azteca]
MLIPSTVVHVFWVKLKEFADIILFFSIMSLEQTACEDLKAFERRLTEVIAHLKPATVRWRLLLLIASSATCWGAWLWLADPLTTQLPFLHSLLNHYFFTIATLFLVLLFMSGVHRKVMAPSIIASRTRAALRDFNMSCDDTGKLILKPRPA